MSKNMLVPYYLMASYRYYEADSPMISDTLFDECAKKLLSVFDEVEHYHKHLISEDMLEGGTYIGSYPTIVADASYAVSDKIFEKRLRAMLKEMKI